jgi:Competence protein J (ComJ)
MAHFIIDVSYNQVSVFDANLDDPFNDWSDEHVAQGFAWRPGSVSFGTLENAGTLAADVYRSKTFDESSSSASRVIAVPFSVPAHGNVEVASIASGVSLQLPAGEYELTFEHGIDDRGMWACFYFRAVPATVAPRIVRADAELTPPATFVMAAQPA